MILESVRNSSSYTLSVAPYQDYQGKQRLTVRMLRSDLLVMATFCSSMMARVTNTLRLNPIHRTESCAIRTE